MVAQLRYSWMVHRTQGHKILIKMAFTKPRYPTKSIYSHRIHNYSQLFTFIHMHIYSHPFTFQFIPSFQHISFENTPSTCRFLQAYNANSQTWHPKGDFPKRFRKGQERIHHVFLDVFLDVFQMCLDMDIPLILHCRKTQTCATGH